VKKADGNDAGDINMAYEITETCQLKSLFPTHALVQVEVDVCLRKGSRLLVELTASTRDSILDERNGKESKLTRKVNFFNYLLKEDTDNYLADGDFCLIVYNGQDPVTVKKAFEDLNPQFSGAVVHFQRKFVINWDSQEIVARLARALEEARAAKEETARVVEEARAAKEETARVVEEARAAKEKSDREDQQMREELNKVKAET